MEFIDLKSQQKRLQPSLGAAINRVLSHGRYVMGPEVEQLETALAGFTHTKYALGCANGTDALTLALMAMGVKAGDAVFCPSFTYSATAESIAILGATPVFVDIDRQTYNLCADSLERTIQYILTESALKPRAVIIVDLFGQIANYPLLSPIARKYGMQVISDAAQSFGATLNEYYAAHWVDVMTTSFFPAKPLGCYGDGGAIFTNNAALYEVMKSLRNHGAGANKYDNIFIGRNSRLDTLQATILLEKLTIFPDELKARNNIANKYIKGLSTNMIVTPRLISGSISTWAQFTIEVETADLLASRLSEEGIPTARYYPRPTHLQTAYQPYPCDPDGLPNTQAASKKVISLPMHAYLDDQTQDKIITSIREFV